MEQDALKGMFNASTMSNECNNIKRSLQSGDSEGSYTSAGHLFARVNEYDIVDAGPLVSRRFNFPASKDRTVRIWRLTIHQDDHLRAEVKEVARKHHHDSEVWRVEWNVTGTMLVSSGDDSTVRMWKSDFEDEWACVNTIL
ncbi:hypothetical protein PsorP6_006968 [Peronosclerospora sorghi]|uniref:Uncharacterized protein n=1 Tax=Peronosclerospora sorghi TaxID=230839 RepID=A0ACC0WCT5_9STRA|nr:hypothetical protein PsorP6_006968 [Peronosclerospora sorghi]